MGQIKLADTYDMDVLLKEVQKVKLQLMLRKASTFFSALLANLDIQITERIELAATNGSYMKLNPYFIAAQTMEELLGLMLHEVLHIVFDHLARCIDGKLDHNIYNIAGDHYINIFLTDRGYHIPDGGYCDYKYRGMSTMQIYLDLMKNPPDTSKFSPDIVVELDAGGKDMTQEQRESITNNVVKAVLQAQIAKDHGSIPGEVLQRIDDVLNPALPWHVILQNYMHAYNQDDYSWRRPNKRYMPDFYLPSLFSEGMDQMTAGSDVSGSMCEPGLLDTIMAEIRYIWDTLQPKSLHLMTFDTEVHLDKIFEEGDTLDDIELMGGGGTIVEPLLESIKKECPELALIFTDGYFATPDMRGCEGTDIFWIIVNNPDFTAPQGEVIHFN